MINTNPAVLAKRFVLFVLLGVVLRIITGETGTRDNYYYAIKADFTSLKLLLWIGIGVAGFVLLTFWPVVSRYLVRPGGAVALFGLLTVVVGQTVLGWYEKGQQKFSGLSSDVVNTKQIAPIAKAFFGWLAWVLFIVVVLLVAAAIVTRNRIIGYVAAAAALASVIVLLYSQHLVMSFVKSPDHSWGPRIAVLGYVLLGSAALAAVLSSLDHAQTKRFVNRAFSWRPGFVLLVAAFVLGAYSLAAGTWLLPKSDNWTLSDVHNAFKGTGLAPIAVQYFIWLGYVLLLVTTGLALAASLTRSALLGLVTMVVAIVSLILTLNSLYAITDLAAESGKVRGTWKDLGEAGWWMSGVFLALAGSGLAVIAAARRLKRTDRPAYAVDPTTGSNGWFAAPGANVSGLAVVAAFALFFIPTVSDYWSTIIVTQIGIFVFLAVGLNVVVGWAGLLDLGFIAFYAVGAYVAAYLVGALPISPGFSFENGWVLLAIPFAVVACLIAGVILGFPTLRLRGDYLAIVTLGFGEIVQIIANNANGITNGPRGANVPHPVLNLGFHRFVFNLDQLPYWYLLLFAIVVVIVLFRLLENSRTGRAWAAIREDEVAAQATGINPVKYKLLAFAIGASTSGIAGVLFATDVGFFNPQGFVLQTSILVVAYVVFGGMGSLMGAVAGAAFLTWLPFFLRDVVPLADVNIYIGAILVIMMIFRPAGLIPAKRRATELRQHGPASAEVQAVPASGGMGGDHA